MHLWNQRPKRMTKIKARPKARFKAFAKKLYGTIECAHSSVEVRVEVRVILGTVVFYAQL